MTPRTPAIVREIGGGVVVKKDDPEGGNPRDTQPYAMLSTEINGRSVRVVVSAMIIDKYQTTRSEPKKSQVFKRSPHTQLTERGLFEYEP